MTPENHQPPTASPESRIAPADDAKIKHTPVFAAAARLARSIEASEDILLRSLAVATATSRLSEYNHFTISRADGKWGVWIFRGNETPAFGLDDHIDIAAEKAIADIAMVSEVDANERHEAEKK